MFVCLGVCLGISQCICVCEFVCAGHLCSFYLGVCLGIYRCICVCVSLSMQVSCVRLSGSLFRYLCVSLFFFLFCPLFWPLVMICRSVVFICLSGRLFMYLSVYLCVCLSVHCYDQW